MIDINTALEVAEKIDDRVNLLENAFSVKEDGAGGTDVVKYDSNNSNISDADANGLQAGEYIKLDGMPGGTNDNGVFDMSSTQGALALGLYQQMTDTIAQGLTSTIDQGKKIDTQIKRTLNS